MLVRGYRVSGSRPEATAASSGDAGGLASMEKCHRHPEHDNWRKLRVLKGLPKHWGTSGDGTCFRWRRRCNAVRRQRGRVRSPDAWSGDRDGYDEGGQSPPLKAALATTGASRTRALDAQSGVEAKQAWAPKSNRRQRSNHEVGLRRGKRLPSRRSNCHWMGRPQAEAIRQAAAGR